MTTTATPVPLPTPSGQVYLFYTFPGDDPTQPPLYVYPPTGGSNSRSITLGPDPTKADPLTFTNIDTTAPNLVNTTPKTLYGWPQVGGSNSSFPAGGMTIQSNNAGLTAGENYLFIEAGQEQGDSQPMYYSQTASELYKSTFFLSSADPYAADGTPLCWAAGVYLSYLWDDSKKMFFIIYDTDHDGWWAGLGGVGQNPTNSTVPTISTIFYLLPTFPLAACSGTAGQCSTTSLTYDPFDTSGVWATNWEAMGSTPQGCLITYNQYPVVIASASNGSPNCPSCPAGQTGPPAPPPPPPGLPPGGPPPGYEPPPGQPPGGPFAPGTVPPGDTPNNNPLTAAFWTTKTIVVAVVIGIVVLFALLLLWRGYRQWKSSLAPTPPTAS